jgi:hypothetical protein
MRAIVLSLAVCAVSAASVGFIIADAISAPTHHSRSGCASQRLDHDGLQKPH